MSIEEGNELAQFWNILCNHDNNEEEGLADSIPLADSSNNNNNIINTSNHYANAQYLHNYKQPQLFRCEYTDTFRVEQVSYHITQGDLVPRDCFILDAYYQLYVWQGNESNELELEHAMKTAKDYMEKVGDGRGKEGMSITMVKQGKRKNLSYIFIYVLIYNVFLLMVRLRTNTYLLTYL